MYGARASGSGQQGTHAAIRMGDEMCTVAQRLGDIASVDFEILAIGCRARAKSSAIQNEQGAAIRQRVLDLPGRGPARDAPVYEQSPGSVTTPVDVQVGHLLSVAPSRQGPDVHVRIRASWCMDQGFASTGRVHAPGA